VRCPALNTVPMADHPVINLALYAQTDVGMVRSGNEDSFLILDLTTGKSWTANEDEHSDLLTYSQGYYGSLLAVSDGMGGALAGEVASRMAVETVRDQMLRLQAHGHYAKMPFHERLRLAIEDANVLINREGMSNPEHKGLGATFTAVATVNNQIYFAQVGDSRAYLIRQGKIARITKDQSLVQQLIDAGQITEEEAETHSYRNVILQALGAHINVNVEVNTLQLCQLDTLVLCSDGLSGKIQADEIARIVHAAADLKSACEEMIKLANERGGEDNITVVVAQFSGSGLPPAGRDPIEAASLARSPDTPSAIDWDLGMETERLMPPDAFPTPPESATEPLLPATPTAPQSPPTTKRPPANPPRTSDLAGRRGPITAVFNVADLQEGEPQTASLPEPAPAGSTSPAADELEPSDPGASPADVRLTRNHPPHAPAAQIDGGSKNSRTFLNGLVIIGLVGVVLGAAWYFSYRARQQTALKEAERQALVAKEERKQSRIKDLRERIAELNRSLEQAADKPAVQERRQDLAAHLRALDIRLDQVSQKPLDQLPDLLQDCEVIEKEIQSLTDEVNKLLGLLPSRLTPLQPVEC